MKVGVFADPANGRSVVVCKAMLEGAAKNGDTSIAADVYSDDPRRFDAVVFYGLRGPFKDMYGRARGAGVSTVYADLGFWNRKRFEGDVNGYHKLSVNCLHATHVLPIDVPTDRFEQVGIDIKPYIKGKGDHVLLLGLSKKAAWAYDLLFEGWERSKAAQVRRYTDKPIIYRPKPNAELYANKALGDVFSPAKGGLSISQDLARSSFAVMRHSNVAIDALVEGVPYYTEDGIGKLWATPIESLETSPRFPDDNERIKMLSKVAYAQWSVEEMQNGTAWEFLRKREIIK